MCLAICCLYSRFFKPQRTLPNSGKLIQAREWCLPTRIGWWSLPARIIIIISVVKHPLPDMTVPPFVSVGSGFYPPQTRGHLVAERPTLRLSFCDLYSKTFQSKRPSVLRFICRAHCQFSKLIHLAISDGISWRNQNDARGSTSHSSLSHFTNCVKPYKTIHTNNTAVGE